MQQDQNEKSGIKNYLQTEKSHIEIMEIVAIGERDKQKVYKDALTRLDDDEG